MIVAASKVAKAFSSDRMLSEYLEECYVPGAFHRRALKGNDREPLKLLVAWKERVRAAWPGIGFDGVEIEPDPASLPPAAAFEVTARVRLNALDAGDVAVELFEGPIEADGTLESGTALRFEPAGRDGEVGIFKLSHRKPSGEGLGYTLRVRPWHTGLAHPNETGMMVWWGPARREARRYQSGS